LQSFPDWFEFAGSESDVFTQIGNAVPPMFAYHLAVAVKAYLSRPRTNIVSSKDSYGNGQLVMFRTNRMGAQT